MKELITKRTTKKQYTLYLIFMLIACGGAIVWQLFIPSMGQKFTSWGSSIGWQREIALWNIGIITVILLTLIKKNESYMKLVTLQATVLCWVLGINHLISFIANPSPVYVIHILGIIEVMLLGGSWGTILLIKSRWIKE